MGSNSTEIWVGDFDLSVYRYNMTGTYLGSWVRTAANGYPGSIVSDGAFIWVVDPGDKAVYKYVLVDQDPTITSATITDMDDTDNVYAMESYYSFRGIGEDPQGADTIAKFYMRGMNEAATLWEVRGDNLDGVASWSIQSGSTIIDLDTGSCTFGEAGDVGTATFKIRTEGDHGNLANLELAVYIEDEDANSVGWTTVSTNYWDAISRLVTTSFTSNDGRINRGASTTLSETSGTRLPLLGTQRPRSIHRIQLSQPSDS